MKKISAEIVADSISPQGHRITSYILTYPRFIHAELMTHRMFSRNSASSRAIPFEKMVKMVEDDPFIPIAWQSKHFGMQGNNYITDEHNLKICIEDWLEARNNAIKSASDLSKGFNKKDKDGNWIATKPEDFVDRVTKQLCNRLLEPFMWHTVLVTATEWENFFELRCPKYELSYYPLDRPEALEPTEISFRSKKDYNNFILKLNWTSFQDEQEWYRINTSQAEIHIQALAEAMWDARNESIPKKLKEDEWHIPFGDKLDKKEIDKFAWITNKERNLSPVQTEIAICSARCARLSYMTFDGEIDYKKDIKLHDQLLASKHMSPFEHVARCMTDEEYYSFIKGQVPSTKDGWGILNYEYYPLFTSDDSSEWFGQPKGENKNNGDRYGWCNNFRGFISYRYMIENGNNNL